MREDDAAGLSTREAMTYPSHASHEDPGTRQLRPGAHRRQRGAAVPRRSAPAAADPADRDRRQLDPATDRDQDAALRAQRWLDGVSPPSSNQSGGSAARVRAGTARAVRRGAAPPSTPTDRPSPTANSSTAARARTTGARTPG